MFYGNNRNDVRRMYFTAWHKAQQKSVMEPLESLIADVIQAHPEYHSFLNNADNIDKDFPIEHGQTNPFMHMGMHMAIKEQLSVDQPLGIRDVYQQLMVRHQDEHNVEHQVMECLGKVLWEAQANNQLPDMIKYMQELKELAFKTSKN